MTLVITTVLLMMIVATMAASRQGRFDSTRHANQLAALFAAEAGVNDAIVQFHADRNWAPTTPHQQVLPNGHAAYQIQFASIPVGDRDLSVNNLSGATPVDGPRGPNTVPAASAYLVVLGSAGDSTQRLEVILKASPLSALQAPLVSDGRLAFAGPVYVDGIKAFNDITPADSDIHSNLSGAVPGAVYWGSLPGESFVVRGEVSARSTAVNAVSLNTGPGTVSVQGQQSSAGSRPFPDIEIDKIVARASGAPVFTPVAGVNVLGGGDHRYGGGVVQGDLILNDSTLYVSGNLRVNGSITGTGSIFVVGNTNFSGAAEVNVGPGHVALYSQGHVSLDGFNGTEFLNNTFAGRLLDNVTASVGGISQEISANPGAWQADPVDGWRAILGHPVPSNNWLPQYTLNLGYTWQDSDSLGQLIQQLTPMAQGPNPGQARTANFLIDKLTRLQTICAPSPGGNLDAQPYLQSGTITTGMLDDIIDGRVANGQAAQAAALMEGELRNYSFDAIGTSYFKGIVYTNGAFYSQNEVQIVGGVYVEANDDSPTTALPTANGNLSSGEVFLEGGSRFTYVESLLEESASNSSQTIVVPTYWSSPSS